MKHIPRFRDTSLNDRDFMALVAATKERGMLSIVTPFDEPSVCKCINHGVDILKVASCSATDWPLFEAIAETHKPVVCSTGGLSIYDIDKIVSFFRHRDIELALMHCVALYPTPRKNLGMASLERMSRRYPYNPVGYSGHEEPNDVLPTQMAIAQGAQILERHVGLETDTIQLNEYSMNPEQVDRWIAGAKEARVILGDADGKQITQEERDSLRSLQRGVFAKSAIKKGTKLTRNSVFFAMPCAENQCLSGEFGRYRTNLVASKDYEVNDAISEHAEMDRFSVIRSIMHDAKGMLYEAGIELGEVISVELSHHSGIDHFRSVGALILDVINREYCKKVVVVLAGQRHPKHLHKVKEETFHVLWGHMDIDLEGNITPLKPGDQVLVKRNAIHGWFSAKGCIFEEVSSTHIKGDSYYEDDAIASLDLLQRKTQLEEW